MQVKKNQGYTPDRKNFVTFGPDLIDIGQMPSSVEKINAPTRSGRKSQTCLADRSGPVLFACGQARPR